MLWISLRLATKETDYFIRKTLFKSAMEDMGKQKLTKKLTASDACENLNSKFTFYQYSFCIDCSGSND